MSAVKFDLTLENAIEVGASYQFMVRYPLDLTTWTFKGQIRPRYDSEFITGAFTFSVNYDAPNLRSEISCKLRATVTKGMEATRPSNPGVYDIIATHPTDPDIVLRIVEGIVEIKPGSTR